MALERKNLKRKRMLFNETIQYNIKILIKIYFPSKGQDKSKEQEGNILYNDTLNTFYLVIWEGERNVLFNDALNTFYLRLYGVRHMVKDHSDSEKGNPLPPHRLLHILFTIIWHRFLLTSYQ